MRPSVQPKDARACVNAESIVFHGIVFVVRHEHADAPYAVALLGARRERPSRRAAEERDELAPSKANAHLALPSPKGALSRRIARPKRAVLTFSVRP